MDTESQRRTLPKSGCCPICQVHYKGLLLHYNACARKSGAAAQASAAVPVAATGRPSSGTAARQKCEFCSATYVSLTSKYYQNHLSNVHNIVTENNNQANEPSFMQLIDDNYFDESLNISTDEADDVDDAAWILPIKQYCSSSDSLSFTFAHININSIFNKLHHVCELLESTKLDFLCVSETKIDETTPSAAIEHPGYNLIRRDRTKSGGGLALYVKKCYSNLISQVSSDFELIYFKLRIKRTTYNFVTAYKPPNESCEIFNSHLEEFIQSLNHNEKVFVIGDLNQNWFDSKGNHIRTMCEHNNLKNFVTSSTRDVYTSRNNQLIQSSSLIDLILHNGDAISKCSPFMLPFTDHALVVAVCNFNTLSSSAPTHCSRSLNEAKLVAIAEALSVIDFSILNEVVDINARWLIFKQIVLNIINAEAPLKKKKPKKHEPVPWYDAELLAQSRRLDKLNSKFLKSKTPHDHECLKAARNAYTSLFRRKQTDFYLAKSTKGMSSKAFWDFYSLSMPTKNSKGRENNIPSEIRVGQASFNKHEDIASKFSDHFSSLKPSSTIPLQSFRSFVNNHFSSNSHLLPKRSTSFNFMPTTCQILEKVLSSISSSSSAGVSEINTVIVKKASTSFVPFLTSLFNDCIRLNTFPDEFKSAIVLPLFKRKGQVYEMNNYRSISILPAVCKVFEKILAEQLRLYFIVNKLFDANQHGFRSKHSCETALHEIISTCLSNLDKKHINLLLFIDFQKAFDSVDPELLLVKLLNYGLSNNAIALLRNYFNNRNQRVKVGDVLSEKSPITLGVPQGSVLGPLLFVIFINDLPSFFKSSCVKLFADDTTFILDGASFDQIKSKLLIVVRLLADWCQHNRLAVNWSKTFLMLITNKRIPHPVSIDCDGTQIAVVKNFKLLGVLIDDKLCFMDFVASSVSSINKKVYAINRLFYISFSVKMQFFKSFVLPYFDYCLSLCIYFSKMAISKLTKCYYNCLFRLFNFRLNNLNPVQINVFLSKFKLNSFQHRIIVKLSFFSFNIKNCNFSPSALHQALQPFAANHTYNLRTSRLVKSERFQTRYGESNFQNFFCSFF